LIHRQEHQLTSALPSPDGLPGLVLSASKELEPGVRAMLLLADGLFRLDVVVSGDTLRTIVRNLSAGELRMHGGACGPDGGNVAQGEAVAYEPGRAAVAFTIGSPPDAVSAEVTLGTLRFAERGTVRVSAQAIVREKPTP
jgi:hypothetical protein